MIEYRQIKIQKPDNEESRKVSGYACVFNSSSRDIGFIETVSDMAITEDTILRSDVFATLNHNPERVLARCKYGSGSLQLSVDERGLRYEYEAPHTALGDEVIEAIRRGDLTDASFAFTIDAEDPDAQKWEKRADGTYVRTIYKIAQLYDISNVWTGAYAEASSEIRSNTIQDYSEEINKLENMIKEQEELRAEEKTEDVEKETKSESKPEDEEKETKSEANPEDEDKETKSENTEDPKSEQKSEDEPEKEQKSEDEDKQEKEENDDNKQNRSNDKDKNIEVKKMVEKRFSLIDAINDVANNRPLDNIASKVNEIGTQEMRSTGLSFGGQIQIPTSELRAAVTVAAEGEDVVATDLYDIVGPLRAKNVLVQAGADFLTGLVGDVQIPIMSATNVNWAGETAGATDGAPEFTNVTLSPKRLTAYVEISKQLLAQHSVAVENKIREDIIKAINSKLEATILGSSAGSTTQPAGIFYDATPTVITGIDGIAEVEGAVEEANVFGDNLKWIINPKFKAALRGMAKGENIAQSLYENDEIDGTPALSTSNVGSKLGVYGSFSDLAIGQWGSIDLTVDPYTQAKNGKVVLVINAFFDAKVVRPEAFGFATTATVHSHMNE